MHRFFAFISCVALSAALGAKELPVTVYTVIAQVTSFENSRPPGSGYGRSLDAPYGSEGTIVAMIIYPDSLAGREVAIPYESRQGGRERLVKRGTFFRFEHTRNLADLRDRTDFVRRRTIAFPGRGILVIEPDGKVVEAYEGVLTALK